MADDNEEHVVFNEINEYWLRRKFECYPFKVKWYNDVVAPVFRLPYADDTLALVILSVPGMFDTTFIPFICENNIESLKDPIDNCMIHQFNKFKEEFTAYDMSVIHDFELNPNRRPKVLVQTAGHVSGATYFYQRTDVINDPWQRQKIFGVSIHPRFGGWFGFRGVVILKDVTFPNLRQKEAKDVVPLREKRIELLEKFNFHWRDSSYRDVISVAARYSSEEKLYFDTAPKDREKLIELWKNGI